MGRMHRIRSPVDRVSSLKFCHFRLLTQSIMEFVNKMNHMFLEPALSSPVDSAHPTEPAGYSPPIPMPTYGLSDRYLVSDTE